MKRASWRWGGVGRWCAAAVSCLSLAAGIRADVTWMQPERFAVTPGATLWIELTEGEAFTEPVRPIPISTIDRLGGVLDAAPVAMTAPVINGGVLHATATLPRPGVAVFVAQLKPEPIQIPRGDVERYLRHIHAADDVRAAWAAMPASASWRELRNVRLKCFLRVGEPLEADQSWARPEAAGFDLVPDRDPTDVRPAESLPIRIFRDGQPVAGAIVSFVSAGEGREHVIVTDDNGRASAPLDAAGRWLVQAISLARTQTPGQEWQVAVVALCVETRH